MSSLTLIRRPPPKTAMKLAYGALGICSMALMLAVSVGVGANNPASGSQAAPQDKATDKPEEAPTGFNNSTNGFEDQDAFALGNGVHDGLDGLKPVVAGRRVIVWCAGLCAGIADSSSRNAFNFHPHGQ